MPGLPDEGVPEFLHRLPLEILHDEDDAAAAVLAWPTRQDRRHVDHVLHAMDDHRMLGVFRQRNEALHPQQLRALRGAQEVEERVERALRIGRSLVRQNAWMLASCRFTS